MTVVSTYARRLAVNSSFKCQIRSTYVLRHLRLLPKTKEGHLQRSPKEKQSYNYFEEIRNEAEMEPPPLKVILCQYVEGYGNRGDVVDVPANFGRFELLLLGKAVYASEFNLKRFEEERKMLALEDRKQIKLTKYSLTTGKVLRNTLFLVQMNMDDDWTLEARHIRLSLRAQGFFAKDDNIIIPPEPISSGGSEKYAQHGQLFRFYVLINKVVVVPCTGRIILVSPEPKKALIDPGMDYSVFTDDEKTVAGIEPEERIYVHTDYFDDDPDPKEIWDLMQKKIDRSADPDLLMKGTL